MMIMDEKIETQRAWLGSVAGKQQRIWNLGGSSSRT